MSFTCTLQSAHRLTFDHEQWTCQPAFPDLVSELNLITTRLPSQHIATSVLSQQAHNQCGVPSVVKDVPLDDPETAGENEML